MLRSSEEILADIDATLDQLILNAEIAEKTHLYVLKEDEQEAFQKTQESLLARFVHMNDLIDDAERKKMKIKKKECYMGIQNKIRRFSDLNANILHFLASQFQAESKREEKKPKIRKNRKLLKVC